MSILHDTIVLALNTLVMHLFLTDGDGLNLMDSMSLYCGCPLP